MSIWLCFSATVSGAIPTASELLDKYAQTQDKLSASLAENGVLVAALHCSKGNTNRADDWLRANNVRFPVGKLRDVVPQILRAWRVETVPWPILTDAKHVITVEGFDWSELKAMIERGR